MRKFSPCALLSSLLPVIQIRQKMKGRRTPQSTRNEIPISTICFFPDFFFLAACQKQWPCLFSHFRDDDRARHIDTQRTRPKKNKKIYTLRKFVSQKGVYLPAVCVCAGRKVNDQPWAFLLLLHWPFPSLFFFLLPFSHLPPSSNILRLRPFRKIK